MDPDQTFKDFIDAVAADDPEEAYAAIDSLVIWLQKGGSRPNFPEGQIPPNFAVNIRKWILTHRWHNGQ